MKKIKEVKFINPVDDDFILDNSIAKIGRKNLRIKAIVLTLVMLFMAGCSKKAESDIAFVPASDIYSNIDGDIQENGKRYIIRDHETLSYGPSGIGLTNGLEILTLGKEDADRNENFKEQVMYTKMLKEIIGLETLDEYYQTGDINLIIKALFKIIPSYKKAKELVYYIDLTAAYYKANLYHKEGSTAEDWWDAFGAMNEARAKVYSLLAEYFEKANGYPMAENALLSLYYVEAEKSFSNSYYNDGVDPEVALMADGEEISPDCIGSCHVEDDFFEKSNEAPVVSLTIYGYGAEFSQIDKTCTIDDSNKILTASENYSGSFAFDVGTLNDAKTKVFRP